MQKNVKNSLRKVEHESVKFWLSRLSPSGRQSSWNRLANFIDWLGENSPQFADYDPNMLIVYQREAENGERYNILDAVQMYVQGHDLRYGSKVRYYSILKSFFAHNRAPLPDDPRFQIRSDIPRIEGDLPLKELRDLLLSCNECYRAIFLSMFQGGMDQASFIFWNENGWEKLREDLKGDPEVIRIDLPGRKKFNNRKPFYTLIGGDSITAIRNWLKIRPDMIPVLDEEGNPKLSEENEKIMIPNPYIFTNQSKQPIKKSGLYMLWRRTLVRLGYVERSNGTPVYSGKGPHEMRDTFRSMWEKSPAKASVVEFMMGHKGDPLEYNKAYRDEGWTRGEYAKALPYLEIMTSGKPYGQVDEDLITRQSGRVAELEILVERLNGELRDERAKNLRAEERQDTLDGKLAAFNERLEKMEREKEN